MASAHKTYPDNTAIHARKARGWKTRAGIGLAEKLAALDEMKLRVAPIIRTRQARLKSERP